MICLCPMGWHLLFVRCVGPFARLVIRLFRCVSASLVLSFRSSMYRSWIFQVFWANFSTKDTSLFCYLFCAGNVHNYLLTILWLHQNTQKQFFRRSCLCFRWSNEVRLVLWGFLRRQYRIFLLRWRWPRRCWSPWLLLGWCETINIKLTIYSK